MRIALILLALAASLVAAQAQKLDKVRFGTNWVAEAEHGVRPEPSYLTYLSVLWRSVAGHAS